VEVFTAWFVILPVLLTGIFVVGLIWMFRSDRKRARGFEVKLTSVDEAGSLKERENDHG